MARLCEIDGCGLPYKARGYCTKHYERLRQYGDPLGGGRFRSPRPPACTVSGCGKRAVGRGLCSAHYRRLTKYGDVNGGHFHHDKKRREWHVGPRGYVVRYEPDNPNCSPNGYVYQHRHVMAEMIGRALRNGENVHHINGCKQDNRPDNLELWMVGQPAGQRVLDQVKWAKRILDQYGDIAERMQTKSDLSA